MLVVGVHVSVLVCIFVFFCKQKTAYEMRISDWSSDVCSSDLESFSPMLPDDIERLAQQVLETASAAELSLATAESCIGGMIASLLTDVPGVSGCFERGFVVYSERAKCDLPGLSQRDIARCGGAGGGVAGGLAEGARAPP